MGTGCRCWVFRGVQLLHVPGPTIAIEVDDKLQITQQMAAAERVSATLAGQVTRPAIVDQGASYSYIIHMGATRLFSDPTPENKGEIHLKGQKCLKLECRSGAWASQVPEVRTLAYFKVLTVRPAAQFNFSASISRRAATALKYCATWIPSTRP